MQKTSIIVYKQITSNFVTNKFTDKLFIFKSCRYIYLTMCKQMTDVKLLVLQMSYIVPLDKRRSPRRYIKYNLYFHSSTVTFVWSRNKVRESSHISFFCGEVPFCEVVRRPENTYGGADRFAWVTNGSLLQSKFTNLILSFKCYEEIWTSSSPHVFSVYGWLSELAYLFFFR